MSLVLALLGIALEACERLGQILKGKVLQEHSEANTDVGCSSSASSAQVPRHRAWLGSGSGLGLGSGLGSDSGLGSGLGSGEGEG